ncbi:hypothetical protein IWX91DRAFT_393873, partial [Phyllosticta citricarpa]
RFVSFIQPPSLSPVNPTKENLQSYLQLRRQSTTKMYILSFFLFFTLALSSPLWDLTRNPGNALNLFKRQNGECKTTARTPKSDKLGPVTVTNLKVVGNRNAYHISFALKNTNTGIDTTCDADLSIGNTDQYTECKRANTGAIARFKYSTDDDDWTRANGPQSVTIDIIWQFVRACAICPDPNVDYYSYGNINRDIPCKPSSNRAPRQGGNQQAGKQEYPPKDCSSNEAIPVSVTNVCEGPFPPAGGLG